MTWKILQGDARGVLPSLPAESVQCAITSPPYYGLRSYVADGDPLKPLEIGLEKTPEQYIAKLVHAFREVKRVLRPTGVLWVNIGDSFARGRVGRDDTSVEDLERRNAAFGSGRGEGPTNNGDRGIPPGYKDKDLLGIPWMLAFALRADGWYLRSEVIWAKRNTMPESVTDRPTRAHEQVFLLTKAPRYFYDGVAIREPSTRDTSGQVERKVAKKIGERSQTNTHMGSSIPWTNDGSGRNVRSVWTISTKPVKESHFAVMPWDLAERCLLAGTSAHGQCAICGAPYERVTEKARPPATVVPVGRNERDGGLTAEDGMERNGFSSHFKYNEWLQANPPRTVGWQRTCEHEGAEVVPQTVLDPFSGAGTVGMVARRHGRSYLGVELNPDYCEMSRKRIIGDAPLFNTGTEDS